MEKEQQQQKSKTERKRWGHQRHAEVSSRRSTNKREAALPFPPLPGTKACAQFLPFLPTAKCKELGFSHLTAG